MLKTFFIRFIFFICSILSINSFAQEGKIVDRVIAVVGKKIVTQSEFESQYLQYTGEGQDIPENMRCKVYEELLYQKLLIAQADKDSVTVTDQQVDDEIERRLQYYIQQFGSVEKFESFYGKTSAEFKEDLRDNIEDLLLAQTMQGKITNGISVTPSEVKQYFENIPADSVPFINSEVEIGQIVKKPYISPEAKKEAKDKLANIRERILKGENFTTMAALYSEDPASAKRGGRYDSLRRGMFEPAFEGVAFRLKVMEVSEIFETVYGYHIVQQLERRGEVIDIRHILIAPAVSAEDMQKAKNFLDSVYTIMQNDTVPFAERAAKFSDDEETRNSGGLIINPQTGTTRFEMDELGMIDPTLVFSIDKMKPGMMLKPGLFGTKDAKQAFRIIYLKTRTEPHKGNLKDDYQRIQSIALAQKQQKVISDWIKKKRVGMYVKMADDFKNCTFTHSWVN